MSKFGKFILLLTSLLSQIHIVLAEDFSANTHPFYQDGKLTIPRVDTPEKMGNFQEAILQFDEQLNAWRLLSFKTIPTNEPLTIVKSIVTDSFPVQVFLQVSDANFICSRRIGQINQRLEGNRFEVSIDIVNTYSGDPLALCAPYQEVIQLSVYGLNAGDYEYRVNGGNVGTFKLATDNKLLLE